MDSEAALLGRIEQLLTKTISKSLPHVGEAQTTNLISTDLATTSDVEEVLLELGSRLGQSDGNWRKGRVAIASDIAEFYEVRIR
jgi:hypothetical protein